MPRGLRRPPSFAVRRALILALPAALVLGWAAPAEALTEQEQRARILFQTREQENRLIESGFLLGDAALDAYLQSVLDRLYPSHQGEFRVRVVRNLDFNAFAVATGNLYVHQGALLRLRNEAELASVIGHEVGHIIGDHMYRGTREAKALVRIFIFVPLLGPLAGMSSMAGFSRDLEREADHTGIDAMATAGYDAKAAAPVFERMAKEITDRKIKEPPYIFADHPALLERAHSFNEIAAKAGPGELRQEEYLAATRQIRIDTLKGIYERKDGRALISLLAADGQAELFAPEGLFFLAEGYRFRAEDGDEQRALDLYGRSISEHPGFPPAYAARGRIYARQGEKSLALADLEQFVALAPDAREASFARQTIDRIKKEMQP